MDWQDVKTLIAESVAFDGDSSKSISTRTVGSSFDTRCQLLLGMFTAATLYFYSTKETVTLADGEQEIDLQDATNCTMPMSKVMKLYVDGVEVYKYQGIKELEILSGNQFTIDSGTPIGWTEVRPGVIRFERPYAIAAVPESFCAGWHDHAPLTAESGAGGVCNLHRAHVLWFVKFAAICLKENIVTTEAALERLNRFDKQAYDGMMRLHGHSMARYYSGAI